MQDGPLVSDSDQAVAASAPRLHTLLLTDLCDSVALVEQLGDVAAAELFQEHDRVVLRLQQQWGGRLIDRSDGLLLLFERPVNGLGFALDYMRALQQLGRSRELTLRARAGIHVGEVLTWHNSAEAVLAGAKAMEVEGLAKPMAARLMNLAQPGQILLSAVAESLAHRSAREFGERSSRLLWKSHGRWYFKGVPTAQEVFEVGEPGFAPLRLPRSSDKARRDLPWWRRPIALGTGLALLLTITVVVWVIAHPKPKINFTERDWVVLADVRNLTDNNLLDDGLGQAFRISLEQSAYVNVLSDMKARDTLTRMLLPENNLIDRSAAIQIASRDGARAVLEPSIREVHGRLRVSVEVVDPSSGKSVYSVHADGDGIGSVLGSIDEVVVRLRGHLGEALADVRRASSPLPKVATENLDALHVYAVAQTAYGKGEMQRSLEFYEVATRMDAQFAMAYLGQMRSYASLGQLDEARARLGMAERLRDRLSAREALYMDAWKQELIGGNDGANFHAWKMLADLYPDHYGANINQALAALSLGRYAEAEQAVMRVNVPQNGYRSATLQLLGRVQLVQGKVQAAVGSLSEAVTAADGRVNRYLIGALATSGDRRGASDVLLKLPPDNPGSWLEGAAFAFDDGRPQDAMAAVQRAARQCVEASAACEILSVVGLVVHAAADSCLSDREIKNVVYPLLEKVADPALPDRGQRLYYAAAGIYAAQRLGLGAAFSTDLPRLEALAKEVGDVRAAELVSLVRANALRLSGQASEALPRIHDLVNGGEIFQVHSVLAAAYRDVGDTTGAERELSWMRQQRGRAYAEYAGSSTLQALNVRDSAAGPALDGCHRPSPAALASGGGQGFGAP
jgi:putative peptide modification system cyclase